MEGKKKGRIDRFYTNADRFPAQCGVLFPLSDSRPYGNKGFRAASPGEAQAARSCIA